MKNLQQILSDIVFTNFGNVDLSSINIQGITADSRAVVRGSLFVAVKGYTVDGHNFISQAIESGAVAIIAEKQLALNNNIPLLVVQDAAEVLGKVAHAFYDFPSHHVKLIGITGTNGKTSVATICYHLFQDLGFKTGLISTVENKIHNVVIPSSHTTPDTVQLNSLLAQMAEAGCDYVFMEVSSHAAHQKRIAGLKFTGAAFTNITHDHLDYHKTFDQYIKAKKSFFDGLDKSAFAIVNADDKNGTVMLQNCKAKKYYVSVKGSGDFSARIKENAISGLVLNLDGEEFHSQLPGEFNAWNILTVYAIARVLEFSKSEVLAALSKQTSVEGRFDTIYSEKDSLTGIIDYAHTPDAVEKILSTLRAMLNKEQHILTVIGCGGDRDKTKRPLMAKVAATLSDKTILTSDNPRNEIPELIIQEMEEGIDHTLRNKTLSITDRKEAIKTAVMLAKNGDVICVTGKGHEKYQEIKGVKHPFDDKKVLSETFKTLLR